MIQTRKQRTDGFVDGYVNGGYVHGPFQLTSRDYRARFYDDDVRNRLEIVLDLANSFVLWRTCHRGLLGVWAVAPTM